MVTDAERAYFEFERVFGSVNGDYRAHGTAPEATDTIALHPDGAPGPVTYRAAELADLLARLPDGAGVTPADRQRLYPLIASAVVQPGDE